MRRRDAARRLARLASSNAPSFVACPAAMRRWLVVDGVADAFALARPSAGAEARAPRATLWTEQDEEPLPNRAATVREAFPARGGREGGVERAFRGATEAERARGVDVVLARENAREKPLVVDAYARESARDTFRLTDAGVDAIAWFAARGARVGVETDDGNGLRRVEPSDGLFGGAETSIEAGRRATHGGQSANECLMIVPSAFGTNAQAARDNHFMASTSDGLSVLEIRERAVAEHKALYRGLRALGIEINLFTHDEKHATPDACFPNNWHTLRDGKLKLFPMKDENRRLERREDIIEFLKHKHPNLVVDDSLLRYERQDPPKFLEGTGSLVVDHEERVAYVALSERAHEEVVAEHCAAENLTPITFKALDARGRPIYHTNVMMSVCSSVAIVCADSIADPADRRRVLDALAAGGRREIITITHAQVDAFCGNVLELRTASGEPALACSARAFAAFDDAQRARLRAAFDDRVVAVDFSTIERVGGGGVRCAVAEHFVP